MGWEVKTPDQKTFKNQFTPPAPMQPALLHPQPNGFYQNPQNQSLVQMQPVLHEQADFSHLVAMLNE
ncbi:hypothetical protein Ciccas_009851, partial [Cichlidogyrus casuarinus]